LPQTFGAVGGLERVMPGRAQLQREDRPVGDEIVDDQDSGDDASS
jgi:hypothetical protein